MTVRTTVIVVLIAILAALPLRAEQVHSQSDVWRTFAEKLEPGAFITVRLSDGSQIRGTFIQISGNALEVKPKTRVAVPVRQLPLTEVASIELDKPGLSAGWKFVIAAGVGVAVIVTTFLVNVLTATE